MRHRISEFIARLQIMFTGGIGREETNRMLAEYEQVLTSGYAPGFKEDKRNFAKDRANLRSDLGRAYALLDVRQTADKRE